MLSSTIDAAPHPRPQTIEVFYTSSLYPNFFYNHLPQSFNTYTNPFYQTTGYLSNLNGVFTNLNGKNNATKNGTDEEKFTKQTDSKIQAIDTIVVNTLGNDKIYKLNKPDRVLNVNAHTVDLTDLHDVNSLNSQSVKNGKDCKTPAKIPSATHAFLSAGLDPIFGPEVAPHYEIHYTPNEHYNFNSFPLDFDFNSFNQLSSSFIYENKNETAKENGKDNNSSKKPEWELNKYAFIIFYMYHNLNYCIF